MTNGWTVNENATGAQGNHQGFDITLQPGNYADYADKVAQRTVPRPSSPGVLHPPDCQKGIIVTGVRKEKIWISHFYPTGGTQEMALDNFIQGNSPQDIVREHARNMTGRQYAVWQLHQDIASATFDGIIVTVSREPARNMDHRMTQLLDTTQHDDFLKSIINAAEQPSQDEVVFTITISTDGEPTLAGMTNGEGWDLPENTLEALTTALTPLEIVQQATQPYLEQQRRRQASQHD